MKYHLVYRKNGRYDPVLEAVEPGFESIDQGALDHTSQPTEVYLEVPRFLEISNKAERIFETTPAPFTVPAKEFRPFSQDLFNKNLQADFPNIPTPYNNVYNEQTDTRFKLPISEEYDPEGTKIDGRLVEERIIRKIREYTSKSKKEGSVVNIYDNVKPKSKEKRKSVTIKEDDAINVKKCSSIKTIELTANSIVNESLERAVTVAEEIMEEINTELNVKTESQKMTGKNTPLRVQTADKLKKQAFSSSTTQDETCDLPKSVKESIQFYETIDSQVETIANKEEKVDDERKLFLLQEMEESIEVGSVRRKSDIFKKDTVTMVHSNNLKDQQQNTVRYENTLKAFSIGAHTMKRLKKIAEKSFSSKSLLNIFLLYLSNVFISLTKPFLFTKSAKHTFNEDKTSNSYCNKSKNIELHVDERNYLDEENILRRRKLSGSEMAQLSLKKPKELTQRMDTVISEFHTKLNITDVLSTLEKSDETFKVSTNSESFTGNLIKNTGSEQVLNTFNSLEWVAKMSKDEREQVKKDIKLATLAAARRVAERRRTGESQSYDYTKEFDIAPMDIATYIAIVESHVYTNKDAIFDDYVSNLNQEYFTTKERDYKMLQSENIMARSYKLSDHSEKKVDEFLLKRSELAKEEMFAGTSRISEEAKIQESKLDTEYVATVTVEHKPAPFVSSVTTHETRFKIHKDALEQKTLNTAIGQDFTVNEVKDKQIIIECKDETAIKTNLEKVITVEPLNIQDLDEDQLESLTITDVTEEAPIVTLESDLNTAQVTGKETLRQISADFRGAEVIEEENFNIMQNKPEIVVEDKKLVEAHIVNKAIIEEITSMLDEIITESMDIIIPKEESASTSVEIRELVIVKPIVNATFVDFNINFLVPEFIDTTLNYETNHTKPSLQVDELTRANALCTASVHFVTFETEKIENVTIEAVNNQLSDACTEPEFFIIATAICTALSGQIETELFQTDFLEIKPIKEEKVENIEEIKEFYNAFSFCTASCTDIITPMINADVLNVGVLKHEFSESNIEPEVFVTILPIAKPYISQISVSSEEANVVNSEQFREEKSICTEEVKEFHCGYVICTPFCQSVEFIFEGSKNFNVDEVIEEYSTSSLVPSEFKTAVRLNTCVLRQISTAYSEADLIVANKIQEETAQVLVESDKFVSVRPICMALGETADMPIKESNIFEVKMINEESSSLSVVPEKFIRIQAICTVLGETADILLEDSKWFDVEKIKEAICSLREEPVRLTTTLPIATHVYNIIDVNYVETEESYIKPFKVKIANQSEEINKFSSAQGICTSQCNSFNFEESNLFEVVQIKYRKSLERLEPIVYKKILSLSIAQAQSLNTVYDKVELLEPEIFKKHVALTNTEVKNFVRVLPLCQATEEQSTLILREPELMSLTYKVKEQYVNVTLESNRLISALKINTTVINELILHYEKTEDYHSSIATVQNVTTSIHVPKLDICVAIGKAVVEHLYVNLYSIKNKQIENFISEKQVATLTIEPDVFKVAICTLNDVSKVSTLDKNVETQVIKKAKFVGEENISTSESQQFAKTFLIRETTLQDDHKSLKKTQRKNSEKSKFDLHVDSVQEADYLKSFDTVNQAVVLVKQEESEQKQSKKVIKRETDTVRSKSAFTEVEKSAYNISILEKSEIIEADSYKEVSYKACRSEKGEEKSSESIQQTLYLNKNNRIKQSQLREKPQREFLEIEKDTEEDSQIVIKDVTDFDETSDDSSAIQIVQEATDIDSRRSSRELRLQAVEVEEISENVENIASIEEHTDLEKAKAAIDQCAALTIVKQEEINIARPVLEIYETEEELTADMESIATESLAIMSSTKLNEQKKYTEEIYEQLSQGAQESAVEIKRTDMKKKGKSIKTNLDTNTQDSITSAAVALAVSKEFKSGELLTSEQQSSKMGLEHEYVQGNIKSSTISQEHKSEALLTSQKSNKIALQTNLGHEYVQENIEVSAVSQEFKSEEVVTNKKSSELALKTASRHEHVQEKVSKHIEATRNAQEFKSEQLVKKKSGKVALKTDSRYEQVQEKANKNIESNPEVQSPIAPPTPLIDEYIFRLVAPLPKSRSTTPVPIDPKPESSVSSNTDDFHIVKKNLIPVVESEISESVLYSPPLPTPPTSPGHTPVYTKPGLNGGMKRLPRYMKPGLRGGSDRPSITKEEILEVQRKSSILASAITETLKNIERYKKEVGILKKEVATESRSEFDMETDETISNANEKEEQDTEKTKLDMKGQDADKMELDKEDQNAEEKKLDIEKKEPIGGEKLQVPSETDRDEGKLTPDRFLKEDVTNVDEKFDNFSDAFEEVTLVDDMVPDTKRDHSETIEECFDVIENEGQITEGVVEFPSEKNYDRKNPIAKELTPDRPESLSTKTEEHIDKTEKQTAQEVFGTPDEGSTVKEEIANVELDVAADEEVARVTALTPDDGRKDVSKGRSPVLSPRETELLKEAHVISLTRVLSAHMIRESLSPDPQRNIKNIQQTPEDKKDSSEGEKDRTWTSFLQKTTRPGPGQNLKHFADLQNRFEPKEQFTEKTDLRMPCEIKSKDFNSSPIPWQERALADSLGAPSACKTEEPILTPADPPEFLIAIPPDSIRGQQVSTRPSTQDVPRIEIENTTEAEDRNAVKVSVDKIVEEALRVAEGLEIGEEKNRLVQLLSTNIKNITDTNFLVEDQLCKMRSQLQTLAQVPEIISRALENLSEQLNVIKHGKEENIVHKKEVTAQPSEATKQERNKESKEVPQEAIPLPRSKKEVDQRAEKMPAETRGTVTVTESTDKITPQNAKEKIQAWPWGPSVVRKYRINFMKYEKPPIPLDHLQRSEVYRLVHNVEQTPPRRVETLRPAIAEADYRERCRSLSPCPPDSSKENKPLDQFQP